MIEALPVMARLLRRTLLSMGSSYETISVDVPASRIPTVTARRRVPNRPAAVMHITDVSASHLVSSQLVKPILFIGV